MATVEALFSDPIYPLLLVFTTALSAFLVRYAWTRRAKPGARILVVLYLLLVVWSGAELLRVLTGPSLAQAAVNLIYTAGSLGPPVFLLFVIEYSGNERWLTRWFVGLVLLLPVGGAVLTWSAPLVGLSFIEVTPVDTYYGVSITFTEPVVPFIAYNWTVLVISLVLLGLMFLRRRDYRLQVGALVVSTVLPWMGSVAYILFDLPADPTFLGFLGQGIVIWLAVLQGDYIDVMPVARSTVFERVPSGIVVTDESGIVVDANERAGAMLDLDTETAIGRPLLELIEDPNIRDIYRTLATAPSEIQETYARRDDGGLVFYRTRSSPLTDHCDRTIGRTYVVSDVTTEERRRRELQDRTTELRERERELERQNDRLDSFASMVSHDLRNPLNVAQAHATRLSGTGEDGETIERITTAHDRMERIIDDALDLARNRGPVETTDDVELAALARRSWSTVDPDGATLETPTDRTVVGDRSRLQTLLENLFRNAVEHGSTNPRSAPPHGDAVDNGRHDDGTDELTVRVGATEDGFYVEDDGRGIPADEREDVFAEGYSGEDGGTGLGLTIVSDIVDAHGWSIEATESEAGGARFEVKID